MLSVTRTLKFYLRSLTVVFTVFLAWACWQFFHPNLSSESLQYQVNYPDAIRSGLAFGFLVAKVFLCLGIAFAVLGLVLIWLDSDRCLIALLLAGPLIAIAAYLNAPQGNYPSVVPIREQLLWCGTSAIWAALVALAWVRFGVFDFAPSDIGKGGDGAEQEADLGMRLTTRSSGR
jgi:hypothetical protein